MNLIAKPTPSGEGERRAQRGYVPQYDLGARVVYEAIAAGRLHWVGLADRNAGTFDDLVLGLNDRIVAYQLKTSRDPVSFSIRTVLLQAKDLLGCMVTARRKLRCDFPDSLIETVYACDDYPRIDDNIFGEGIHAISSAAFVRAHEAYRLVWSLVEWRASPFSAFISDVQAESQLDDQEFEALWRNARFLVGGQHRSLGLGNYSTVDDRRLRDIAALLPRLVADPIDRDRWSVVEILAKLAWRDPFDLRHGHAFPVDALYQSNGLTQAELQRALSGAASGYVSLVGPPGSGKSTLLAAGLLPTTRAAVIRYLAFVPDEGQGLGRAEAFDFLHDVITQFKHQGLGTAIVPGTELAELRAQFECLLKEAAGRFQSEGIRTLVIVDGLDHVPREERPQHSFLCEFPLPQAVPEGIIFLLGTQRLDLSGLPPSVRDQAGLAARSVLVKPLPREAISRLADAAGVPADVDRSAIYVRTAGHPLSARYVVEGLVNTRTPEGRQEWLRNGPAYGGDVNAFYQRAWHDLELNPKAQQALAYVALAEGPISPVSLDALTGADATDAAWSAAGHLLIRDHRNAWSIFHNSFRLFLRDRTGMRHGLSDSSGLRRRYSELAVIARDADSADPQRWMELRYQARAKDYSTVANLARSERFRAQFIDGRDPGDIRDDIIFGFEAAGALRLSELIVDLILSRHEIDMRAAALGDEVFEALVNLGDLRAALGLLNAEGANISVSKGYDLVDAFLNDGMPEEARQLFDNIEPTDKLFGSESLDLHRIDDELVSWAQSVLAFREPVHFLAALSRLRAPPDQLGSSCDIESYRTELKMYAARGQLMRNHSLSPEVLATDLEIAPEYRPFLLVAAIEAAFNVEDDALAVQRLEEATPFLADIEHNLRRDAAAIAARLNRLDIAGAFLEGVPAPTLAGLEQYFGDDALRGASRQIVTHATLTSRLGVSRDEAARPSSQLLSACQARLETMGQLLGDGRSGRLPFVDPIEEFRDTLDFLQHAEGDTPYATERRQVDAVMGDAVATMVGTASALGPMTFARFVEEMDARLEGDPGRLGRSSVRRAYATAVYKYEYDLVRATRRLDYQQGLERSPAEELSEAAMAASAFSAFGLDEQARSILAGMHDDGLGYSRAARKEPQYILWRDLLERACAEDPIGRVDRLSFFGRLLTGLAKTEGRDAGQRLVRCYLDEAAQAGPAWARTAADLVEETGLATWHNLVTGLVTGVVKRQAELSAAAAVVLGRVGIPFASDHDDCAFPLLIATAPNDLLENVVQLAVTCIETDAHEDKRISFLEEVVDAARARGYSYGTEALSRWRVELPPPRSGESPEDPFFLARTWNEFSTILEHQGSDTCWGVSRAFVRLAARSDYAATKNIFDRVEVLANDGSSIEAVANAAIRAGRWDDVSSYLTRLDQVASDRGSWGSGWTSNAKLRYHKLDVRVHGEAARRVAFDSFVDDLVHRREVVGNLFIDVGDILELLSPRLSWAEAWTLLQNQLSRFREYRIGRRVDAPAVTPEPDAAILADILFRAIDITATELAHAVQAAVVELCGVRGGAAVVAALWPRLWCAGGQAALEGARVAWECRDDPTVRDAVMPWLSAMADSGDAAIRRVANLLTHAWDQQVPIKRSPLPAIYELELPPNSQAHRFDSPSGNSLFSSGLWTDDPYNWTWPLEDALGLTVKATGLGLPSLRARAAQLMARMGGKDLFGPEPVERQQQRFRRLRLHASYRKLGVEAAFRAAREIVGELLAADAIDPIAVPEILRRSGAFATTVAALPPLSRPPGVPRAMIGSLYRTDEIAAWRENAIQDAVRPTFDGFRVLASTAVHTRRHFRDETIVEQYSGPDVGSGANALWRQLKRLPSVVITDRIFCLYDALAQGAVVHPDQDMGMSVGPQLVMLCPRVGAELGWRLDPRHVFRYLDWHGNVVAQTISWRDGGVFAHEADTGVRGQGCLLLVREDAATELESFLARAQTARAWHVTGRIGEEDRNVTVADVQLP